VNETQNEWKIIAIVALVIVSVMIAAVIGGFFRFYKMRNNRSSSGIEDLGNPDDISNNLFSEQAVIGLLSTYDDRLEIPQFDYESCKLIA
jgi:hypothetical protein